MTASTAVAPAPDGPDQRTVPMAVVAGLSPTCGSGVAAGCALQDVSLTVRRAHLTLLLGLVGHDELARALADSRHLLIADEPTGQLATETGLANTALR